MEELTLDNALLPEFDERPLGAQLAEKYRIKAAEKFAEKQYLLERDGVPFSPRGNVCAIAAEKKAGKTWFSMALAAAATSGEYLGMKAREENLKVLYFDTEQDEGDGQRIQKRVHFANGWDFDTDHDEFQVFHLREADAAERRRVVVNVTTFLKADLVIVDGIRDLLTDFNDIDQSAEIIQEHMQLSSALNCCIWDVLHVNPGSEKMRGHLGTELGNKVADIIFLTRKENPQDEDDVTYKAKETDARGHKNIHSVTFRIDDSKPFGMPVIVGEGEVAQMKQDERTRLYEAMKATNFGANGKSWTELEKNLKEAGYGRNERQRMIKDALNCEVLNKANNGRYYFNFTMPAIQNAMPFEANANDEQEPF